MHGLAAAGKPVLVTVGGRPPHPPRVDVATEIIPCPNRVDWRQMVSALRGLPEITSFAVLNDGAAGEVWRTLGWNGIFGLGADIDSLIAALGLRGDLPPAPVPVIVREAVFNRPYGGEEATYWQQAAQPTATDNGAGLEVAFAPADGEIVEERREPSPQAASSHREVTDTVSIALLGAPATGKSTFVAALRIALLRHIREDWALSGADEASTRALIASMNELTSEHQFPHATVHEDVHNLILRGSSERTVRRGFFRRAEKTRQPVSIPLELTGLGGEYFTSDQVGDAARSRAIERVFQSQGILYMFDPTREATVGDAYETTYRLILQHADTGSGGRLPHYLAVCITKFDDPRVFGSALAADLLRVADRDQRGFPRVANVDAKQFFGLLCDSLSRTGTAQLLRNSFDRYFHQDRVRYFVTSSIGFYVDPGTGRFDIDDYQNTVQQGDHNWAIRGDIYPINVAEPVLWLADRITKSNAASLARPDGS
jgi:hypothetical protein